MAIEFSIITPIYYFSYIALLLATVQNRVCILLGYRYILIRIYLFIRVLAIYAVLSAFSCLYVADGVAWIRGYVPVVERGFSCPHHVYRALDVSLLACASRRFIGGDFSLFVTGLFCFSVLLHLRFDLFSFLLCIIFFR